MANTTSTIGIGFCVTNNANDADNTPTITIIDFKLNCSWLCMIACPEAVALHSTTPQQQTIRR